MSQTTATSSPPKTLRFTPGEEYLFVHLDYTPARPRFGSVYLPWEDTLEAMRVIKVRCEEHHPVRSEWDDAAAEPQYQGFIFKDAEGTVYHNQYPTASYGQLTDHADRMLHHAEVTDENLWTRYELLSYRMGEIQTALVREKDKLEPHHIKALSEFYQTLQAEAETHGYSVTVEPLMLRFTDGSPSVVTGRRKVILKAA